MGFKLAIFKLDSREDQKVSVPIEPDVLIVPEGFSNRGNRLGRRPGTTAEGVGRVGAVDHSRDSVAIEHWQFEIRHHSPALRHDRTSDRLKVRHRVHPVTLRNFAHEGMTPGGAWLD